MNIGLGNKRRMVLVVGADPHARAILRNALEGAGFSVGEAADGQEGERTTLRIRPDAILADLALETIDSSGAITAKLKDSHIPVYIVSNAADALVGTVALHDLGISGVFLKPVDPAVVVQTLKLQLAA